MRTHDQQRSRLPVGLTAAERKFFLELRRLVDVAGFSCRDLEELTSSVKSAADNSCFYSKSQWGRWLNAQSRPPRKAIRRLSEILSREEIAADHLPDLWAVAFAPAGTGEPGPDHNQPPCPRQLPAVAPLFIGRGSELATLEEVAGLAAQNNGTVVIIAGTAGAGKTTLANHFGHSACDHFPDGQLHLNLRGFDQDGQPLASSSALRCLLEGLGVTPKSIPTALDDQARLYRTLVSDKRLLIILDNAYNVEQVRPLIPGSRGCLVVITSRNELTGLVAEGAHALTLAPFSLNEALELLTHRLAPGRVQREPQAAAELVDLCARLPLAVSVAAAHAAARPDFPVATLVGELRNRGLDQLDTGDPATTARTIFSWSYYHLSDSAARVFRLLGIQPGPDISVPAVVSLSAIPQGQAHMALQELTRAHLIDEYRPGRFTWHGLLHAYAAEQARAHDSVADLREARLRLLDHYLRTGYAGAVLLAPMRECGKLPPPQAGVVPESLPTDGEAMVWFAAHHQVLLAVVADAADRRFDGYCWQIAWTIAPYLVISGHWQDFASVQRIALAAAQRLGDPVGLGYMHHQLSYAIDLLGDAEAAEAHARQALAVFTQFGNKVGRATCLHALGQTLQVHGRYEEALPLEREALQLRRAHGSAAAVMSSENALAKLHAHLGNYDKAIQHCQQALGMQQEAGSRWYAAETFSTLGLAYSRIGDYAQAITYYQDAIGISDELGDLPSLTFTLTGLHEAQLAVGDRAAAQGSCQQIQKILDKMAPRDAQKIKALLSSPNTNGPVIA